MRRTMLLAAVMLIALAGCAKKETPTFSGGGGEPTVTGAAGAKPVITVHGGAAPTSLVSRDIIPGTGAEAKTGSHVFVHYVGVNFADGKQFDASWDRNQPFDLTLPGQVIEGWNQGIPGMRVGGRRMLIIPPSLGYGPNGQPPVIQPNETLVFVIDLLKIQ